MIALLILIIIQALIAFLLGTVVYDVLHYFLHLFLKSKNKLLRLIGSTHSAHHRFFSASLHIDPTWMRKNILSHVIVEYSTQLGTSLFCLLFFHPAAVMIAIAFETFLFLLVLWYRGEDAHHKPYTFLPAYRGGLFVTADYHALHHVYPHNFYSSYIKLIDCVLGTAQQLAGKRIAMTGASGALGSHMKKLLEKAGAEVTTFKYGVDYTYDDYEKLREPLTKTDILFLCHGSKYENAQQANCDSFIRIIELFKSVHQRELLPKEVWGVGSEIECHPCFGIKKLKVYADSKRNYARQARLYYRDRDIQYRHIVHSAFTSSMGPGLMSANVAAFVTLFFLKRGFRYIPVTYTGFAFLNYFRFVLNK